MTRSELPSLALVEAAASSPRPPLSMRFELSTLMLAALSAGRRAHSRGAAVADRFPYHAVRA